MAWNMGFRKVILEVDSQCVLDLIGKGIKIRSMKGKRKKEVP